MKFMRQLWSIIKKTAEFWYVWAILGVKIAKRQQNWKSTQFYEQLLPKTHPHLENFQPKTHPYGASIPVSKFKGVPPRDSIVAIS